MSFHALPRLVLHGLLIIAMIFTTLVAPAQAADSVLQEAAAAAMAAAMDDMPCGEEIGDTSTQATAHEVPCDCCTPSACNLSACLGIAFLLELPRTVTAAPVATIPVPWNAPAQRSRLVDTPLRPPIA